MADARQKVYRVNNKRERRRLGRRRLHVIEGKEKSPRRGQTFVTIREEALANSIGVEHLRRSLSSC